MNPELSYSELTGGETHEPENEGIATRLVSR